MNDPILTRGIRPNWSLPLAGRTEELEIVRRAADQVRQGHGQVLLISGEAGMGKTRLMLEARKKHLSWFVQRAAHCQVYSEAVSYYPFQCWLQEFFKLEPSERETQAREKIESLFAANPQFQSLTTWIDQYLALLGYPLPPEGRVAAGQWKQQIHRAVYELVRCSSEIYPFCLILDDMQYADPSSEELAAQLVRMVQGRPILFCLIYRGGPRRAWEIPSEHVTWLQLKPLSPEAAIQVVKDLLDSDCLPGVLEETLFRQEELSPLYIEEVVRKLITEEILVRGETGWLVNEAVSEDIIPEDLIEVIQSRMKKMDDTSRRILEAGAVIGRDIALGLLDFLDLTREGLREKLGALEGMGFIHQDLDRRGLEIAFRHTVIRDAVYDSLQQEQKQSLHRQVVRSLLSLHGENSEPHYPLLAYHASQAGMFEMALKYLERSAIRAERIHAFREAIEYYSQILAILTAFTSPEESAEKILEVLLKQSYIHQNLGEMDEARKDLEQAEGLLPLTHPPRLTVTYYLRLAQYDYRTGEYTNAEDSLNACRDILKRFPDPVLEMYVWNLQGILAWKTARFDDAKNAFEEVIRRSEAVGQPLYASNAYNNLGLLSGNRGEMEQALEYHRKALEVRGRMSDEMGLAASHNNIGIIHENTGDYASAERHYRQALELASKTGFWEVETAVLANLGQLAHLRGNLTEAIDFACRSLHAARRSHDLRSETIVLDNLGNAHLALGRTDEARAYYEQARDVAEKIGDRDVASRAWLGLSETYCQRGDAAQADSCWQTARDLIERTGLNEARARLHRVHAEWLLGARRKEEARKENEIALRMAREHRQPREEELCKNLMTRIGN